MIAVVVIQRIDAGSPSNQRVAETPHASQGTCTVSGAGSGLEQKGAQARYAAGMWSRSARRCTMNVNGRDDASSGLSRNGRFDGAGMARGPGPVGFGSARQPRRTIEAFRRHGMSSFLTTILTISSVFWIRFGMTRVSCAPHSEDRSWKNMSSCSLRAHGNVIKRARKSPTISIRTLQ
ncbi:hypothetical protein BGY98DRAFT_1013065 [Russula aff. rugulosa BPL654]|nr:hypothetical protein BGY98DRAFT_1013065 [Russula aff. rugulosa BPL654]